MKLGNGLIFFAKPAAWPMAKIIGKERLARKLKKLPLIVKEDVRRAMEECAQEIVALMKSLAGFKDGNLRRSIGWRWGRAPKGFRSVGKIKANMDERLFITIFAGGSLTTKPIRNTEKGNAPFYDYAFAQEFGTQDMKKNPFFYVSWKKKRKALRPRIRKKVRTSVRKVASS